MGNGNGRAEFAFTPNPQTGRITFVFDVHCFEGSRRRTTQSHGSDRPLHVDDFNTAFYGHLPDGSPAFGGRPDNQSMQHKRADLPEDRSSPHIRTVSNSQAVGDQLSTIHDGTVGGPYQTSADGASPDSEDGGKLDIQGEGDVRHDRPKRLRSMADVSGAGVKRQKLSSLANRT